ncbi:hypothetical protein Tco_1320421 [Tanacetum coccineum]
MDAGELPEMDPYVEAAQQGQVVPPLSPAYVPDPEELEHHIPVYVSEPVYPEYRAPSDDDITVEDQPLPADASPTALSLGYVADSDPEEDLEEEPFRDTNDDDVEENEEKEHLALADSSAIPTVDPVPSAEDTKAFETDESAPTPPPPRPRRTRISVRPHTPMSTATEALIAAVVAALPSSPPPSPLTPLSSPLP